MSQVYERMGLPRGILAGTAVLLTIQWALYAISPDAWPGLTGTVVITAAALGNLVLTAASRRHKVAVVRLVQRWVLNPVLRAGQAVGLNPLGLVLLETRGRTSGLPRRTPIGDGRRDGVLWVVAEHGLRAHWVRNVLADPRVRVRARVGLRLVWLDGVAEVLTDDDPLARQRMLARWRPLRALNASVVRVLGADLVTVRITLAAAHAPALVAA